jgi:hypothetical protein
MDKQIIINSSNGILLSNGKGWTVDISKKKCGFSKLLCWENETRQK